MLPALLSERLLQFLWLHQYFEKSELTTTEGQAVLVRHPGQWNTNQGPDFLEAQLQIADTRWAGNVEIHVRSSDFQKHGHEQDPQYQRLILHVVYQDDAPVRQAGGGLLPTVVLGPRIAHTLLSRYEQLMQQHRFVACEHALPVLNNMQWYGYKEALMAARWMRKTQAFSAMASAGRWEELCWQLMAQAMGGKVNGFVFLQMARQITPTMLARHSHHLPYLEALLLGQCGLLKSKGAPDDYLRELQGHYTHLAAKNGLEPVQLPASLLRMRPANFPTIRLAQLARLYHGQSPFFARLLACNSVENLEALFAIQASAYWDAHYSFGAESPIKPKLLGKTMTHLLLINAALPALFLYASHQKNSGLQEKVLALLSALPPEENKVVKGYAALGVPSQSAFDSQALIELKTQYCDALKCLDCRVGYQLLRKG